MAQQVEATFGNLDILINNARITSDNLLFNMPSEEMERVLRTQSVGPMLLTQRFGMLMMRRLWPYRQYFLLSATASPAGDNPTTPHRKAGWKPLRKQWP